MIPTPPPPVPSWVGAPPPAVGSSRRLGRVAAAAGVAAALAVTGIGSYLLGRHHSPPAVAGSAPGELSPSDAQAQVCGVLKAGYPSVVSALDEDNRFRSAPWSDPNLLAAVNQLVVTATDLADRLDASLTPSTPPELRTAATEYAAGLRAFSISERDHAPDSQINGTLQFYKQVRQPVLRLCGLPE